MMFNSNSFTYPSGDPTGQRLEAEWDVVALFFDNGGYKEYPPDDWSTGNRGWISEWLPNTGFGVQTWEFQTWTQSAYQ